MQTGISQEPSFFRHVGLLAGASAVGPLIAFAAYPALTRLYDPAQFGVLGAFEATLAIALSFCTLRYHLAIAVPDDDVDAAALVTVSVLASAVTSVLLAALLYWTTVHGQRLDRLDSIAHLSWLLPVATFVSGTALALAGWHTRRRSFRQVAASRIAQGFVQVAVQLTLGMLAVLGAGLVAGLVSARASALAVLSGRTGLMPALRRVSLARLVAVAKQHRRLPLVSTGSAIVNIAGQQLSVLIVGLSFGAKTAGLYNLAFLSTVGPAHLVSQAIEQSFLSRLRGAEREARVPELAHDVFRALVAFTAVPASVFAAVAPDVFTLAFGADWTPAGEFARCLVPSVFAGVIGAHLPSLVVLRHWQRVEFRFNLILALARCGALLWGASAGGPLVAVLAYGTAGTVLTLVYSCGLLVAEGLTVRSVAAPLLKAAVAALATVAILLGIRATVGPLSACLVGVAVVVVHLVLTVPRTAVPRFDDPRAT